MKKEKTDFNVFELIKNVTSRVEPFHSEFMGQVLACDENFRNLFFKSFVPETFFNGSYDEAEIFTEYLLGESGKRIDVLAALPNCEKPEKIIGIEVKTSDYSVTENQLQDYEALMCERFNKNQDQVFLIYLTPFSLETTGEEKEKLEKLNACLKFREFLNGGRKQAIHINWDQYAEVLKKAQPIFGIDAATIKHHLEYIEKYITDRSLIKQLSQNRAMAEFFGGEAIEQFFASIEKSGLSYENSEASKNITFPLKENADRQLALLEALMILVNSQDCYKNNKPDKLPEGVLEKFRQSEYSLFFNSLFNEVKKLNYAWLEGKDKIGLRIFHPRYKSSGVSVCTLCPDKIEIRKER